MVFERLFKKGEKKGDSENIETELKFKIDFNAPKPVFPEVEDKTKMDLRYPLILPYAYVHLMWDEVQGEVVYRVEEPNLDIREKEILNILEQGIQELIDISFINVSEKEVLIEYLEKNIKVLLKELDMELSRNSYLKIVYYIYRDFIGLNKIEPLMNDQYIEDIECNGIKTPVYIVHRKFGNIRTNIVYDEFEEIVNFVEKLAQKCGKYVSYANPIMDGRLPDSGARVNATYTEDVTSRGPTFSIRMFTKEAWSPVKLMQVGTVSAEMLAYLWMAIENGANILIVGGTGSGKCVTGDTPVYLPDGKIKRIKDIVEEEFRNKKILCKDGWEYVEGSNFEILSLDKDSLKIVKTTVNKFWRHNSSKKLYKITTRSGRTVTTTPEHPFFSFDNGSLNKIRADNLDKSDRIAVPRNIPYYPNNNNIKIIDGLLEEEDIYAYGVCSFVQSLINTLKKRYDFRNKDLARAYGIKTRTLEYWSRCNSIPLNILHKMASEAGINLDDKIKLKGKTAKNIIRVPVINKDIFRFVALVLADGHLTRGYVEFHNSDRDLLNEFINLGFKLFGIKSKIEYPEGRVTKVRLGSVPIARILHKVFEVPYGNKAGKIIVPKLLFEQDLDCIASFISGIIDCESHVSDVDMDIGMKSNKFLRQLSTLLLRLNVVSKIGGSCERPMLVISGLNNIKKLNSFIGLRNENKINSLNYLINREIKRTISNVDLIPNVSSWINSIRSNNNLSQKEFADRIGVSRRLIGRWEEGSRLPSINTFRELADGFDIPQLKAVAYSDIFWDEVVDIEVLENHKEKYVYDLTVDLHHNFLAGDIPMIVHNTSLLNCLAAFIRPDARIISIEDSVCGDAEIIVRKDNNLRKIKIGDLIDQIKDKNVKFEGEILTLDKDYKLKFCKPSSFIRHKIKKDIYNITTSTGRQIKVTGDHSLFTLGEKGLVEVKPIYLKEKKSFIAVPRSLPIEGNETKHIDLKNYLEVFSDEFLVGDPIKGIFERYNRHDFNVGKSRYQWWRKNNRIKIKELLKINYEFSDEDWDNLYIKTKAGNKFSMKFYLTDDFLRLVGLWLGDGSYDNYNANRVIISNADKECQDLVKRVAKSLNLNISIMSDGISFTLNSCILYKFMKYVLKLDGYSNSKKIPDLIFNLSNRQLKEVLKGYFSADGTIQRFEISCTSQSLGLLEDLQTVFLRLGIISRIQHSIRKDKCRSLTISSYDNINRFRRIGFLQERKNIKLGKIGLIKATHICSDVVPLSINHRSNLDLPWSYRPGLQNIGREHLQRIAPQGSLFNDISHSDILWDKVVKIEKLNFKERYVYDISVPKTEKFICSNIILHNTKELRLMHENWLPSVAREGAGVGEEKIGEVTLFDLLKSSFRQRPDYVIVGEIRGVEAFVLFQGMSSGHASMGTMHADDVKTVIRRLETEPINLSPSLVEILDIICLMSFAKVKGQDTRKLKAIQEIISVKENGESEVNVPFTWDPRRNVFMFKRESVMFNKLITKRGISKEELDKEFNLRTKVLSTLYKNKIIEFEEVYKVINQYYKNKNAVLKRFNLL